MENKLKKKEFRLICDGVDTADVNASVMPENSNRRER